MDETNDIRLEPQSRTIARILLIVANTPSALDAAQPDAPASNGVYGSDNQNANTETTNNSADGYDELDINTIPTTLPEASFGDVANLGSEAISVDLAPGIAQSSETFAHPLYQLLSSDGHQVTWATRTEWPTQINARNERKFDVIVVEADAPGAAGTGKGAKKEDGAVGICRELRSSPLGRYAAILAVVPAGRLGEKARRNVAAILAAGADDFFMANATALEVESRVRLLAQMAYVKAELEAAREQLRLQLQTDDVTKLLNRRFFFQAAHRECGRARRYGSELSCLMVEIDHFKKLCSTLGWDCGDVMLRTVSQVLRDFTRDSDIVARFGDEKFVVLLPETDIAGATMLREKIQEAVHNSHLQWHGAELPLTISVGEANRAQDVAASEADPLDDDPDAGDHADGTPISTREELAELLKAADAALFVAKRGVRLPALAEMPRHQDDESRAGLPEADLRITDLPSLSGD